MNSAIPDEWDPTSAAPSGTVTFLFTDIEGSTRLLKQLRDQYAALLADHRRILRQAFSNCNGHEVDTQGDAFFVAFPRATQAVAAAVEAQRLLAEHAWPEGVTVRVRMGIHTGEPWQRRKAMSAWMSTGQPASPISATAGRCCSPRRPPPWCWTSCLPG